MSSLYVGNLHPECTEATLYQKFVPFGKILNVHICRSGSDRSLGYGYVNFMKMSDAESALTTLNYDLVKGQPIRLMWVKKKSATFNLSANLFVKNIHENIKEKTLHDIFSSYGTILSLKIPKNDYGEPQGIGYVQYEDEDSAKNAIRALNGKLVRGNVLSVNKFKSKKTQSDQFKNVYIKGFGSHVNDESLARLGKRFGAIVSAKVMTDENGDSKGFGFISYESPDSAKKAVCEMNGNYLGSKKLFVGRAKTKAERQGEVFDRLRRKLDLYSYEF